MGLGVGRSLPPVVNKLLEGLDKVGKKVDNALSALDGKVNKLAERMLPGITSYLKKNENKIINPFKDVNVTAKLKESLSKVAYKVKELGKSIISSLGRQKMDGLEAVEGEGEGGSANEEGDRESSGNPSGSSAHLRTPYAPLNQGLNDSTGAPSRGANGVEVTEEVAIPPNGTSSENEVAAEGEKRPKKTKQQCFEENFMLASKRFDILYNDSSIQNLYFDSSYLGNLEKIGEGATGFVKKFEIPESAFSEQTTTSEGDSETRKFVVKLPKLEAFGEENGNENFSRELDLLLELPRSDNIAGLAGVTAYTLIGDVKVLVPIFSFCNKGSLDSLIYDEPDKLTPKQKIGILLGVAKGLKDLHAADLLHNDLSCRNVLVHDYDEKLGDEENKVFEGVIGDFDRAQKVKEEGNLLIGDIAPIKWSAPEALRDRKLSKETDIWSFGATLIEALTGRPPFGEEKVMNNTAAALAIVNEGATPLSSLITKEGQITEERKMIEGLFEAAGYKLESFFSQNPEERPTAEQVVEMLENIYSTLE